MRLFAWLAFGEWRAQPMRNALSVGAIAIGVALGFAVHLVNAAALASFTSGLNRVRGSADLQIRASGPAGFDESTYARLMRTGVSQPGSPVETSSPIAVASPVVEGDATLIDDPTISLHISGIDALRAVLVTPNLVGRPAIADDSIDHRGDNGKENARSEAAPSTAAWFDSDAIFVTSALLDAIHKRVGDAIALQADGKRVDLRIAGRLADDDEPDARAPSGTSSSSKTAVTRRVFRASMDIAGAQWRLGRLGRLSRIDLRLAEGADAAGVRESIAAWLPRDALITSADDDRARTGDLSRAYRVNLDMLALMALFTGAFLVYSTQSLAVARRRAQLALLRVIGVVRRRVVNQVLAEGAMQGVAGGLLGLVAGVAFAAAALRWFGGDLGGGYFAATTLDLDRLVFASPAAALVFFTLGLTAALVGSYLPARAAVIEAPAQALKSAGGDASRRPVSPWAAAALIAAGVCAALIPAIDGLPIAGYVSMALLLFGGIAAMPWVARRVLAPFAGSGRPATHAGKRVRRVALDLATKRLWAAPSAAAVALCGIVASASLMVAMTVMIASFRHSVDAWLGELLAADLYLRTSSGADSGFGPEDVDRLRSVDGVARIDIQKALPLALAPARPPVTLIVRTIAGDDPARSLPLVKQASQTVRKDAREGAHPGEIPIWVSEAMVDLYAFEPGRSVALPLGNQPGEIRYFVAGVWRDYARQFGSIAMRRDDYTRVTGDTRFTDAAIRLAPGASAATVTERLRAELPERLRARAEFAEPAAIRAISLAIFDRSFAVTYLLQAVAIAIGLAGVAATFSAQTLARAKEFGMLRHIGVLKRQITGELATEGALLGVLGAIAGGALGLAISQVLIHVVNPQSFHWTMDTEVPWRTLAAVGIALIVASAGTAVISGRRAMARDAVLAVREDW